MRKFVTVIADKTGLIEVSDAWEWSEQMERELFELEEIQLNEESIFKTGYTFGDFIRTSLPGDSCTMRKNLTFICVAVSR